MIEHLYDIPGPGQREFFALWEAVICCAAVVLHADQAS